MTPSGPPGHIPGYHAPGTLVPIGAIYQMQREQVAAAERVRAAAADALRRQNHHLLLLRPR